MATFSTVQAHFFGAGAAVTGVAPNGVDSLETKERGRYRKWTACTDGGLFGHERAATVHGSVSGALRNIIWSLPSVTAVTFTWVDMDGLLVPWTVNAGAQGIFDAQQPMLFTRQGYLRVSGTGAIGAAGGAIVTVWEQGFADDLYAQFGALGEMPRP